MKGNKKFWLAAILILAVIVGVGLGIFFLINQARRVPSGTNQPAKKEASPSSGKNYLDINSADFDPSKAGKPNPIEEQTPPECCSHPYYHSVWRATSNDGFNWQKETEKFIDHASVPDVLVKDDGTQIVYYVDGAIDTLSCKIVKGSQVSPGNCRIYNFSGEKAWDPEIVKVDNFFRMYFTSPPKMGEPSPEGKPKSIGRAEPKIMTAISKDGISWLEEGVALSGEMFIDPTVIKTDSGWLMIVASENEGLVTATSVDGKTFKIVGSVVGASDGHSPHITKLVDKYALYYCAQGIEVSTSADASSWSNRKVAIGQGVGGEIICDPSVEKLPDGSFVMYYKKQQTKD